MPKEVTIQDENGVDIFILGLNDEDKVTSVSYLEPYAGENIDQRIADAGYEIAIMPS